MCAFIFLIKVLLVEIQGPVHPDAELFFLVGQGIRNNLTPYIDLFESKPPGIFLLTTLSLIVSQGNHFATILQVVGFATIPVLLAYATKNRLLGLCLGMVLSAYLAMRSGALLAEGFGAVFGCLYVFSIPKQKDRLNLLWIGISSVAITLSISMKEPMILGLLAGTILLSKSTRHFVRAFIIPCIAAAILAIIALLTLQLCTIYMQNYLPLMFAGRLQVNIIDPLWLRGFALPELATDAFSFHPLFLLIILLAVLAIHTYRNLAIGGILGYMASSSLLYIVVRAYLLLGQSGGKPSPFLVILTGCTALCILITIGITSLCKSSRAFLLQTYAFLFFITLAVGIGGTFYNQHFGFAVPGIFALFVFIVQDKKTWLHNTLFALILLLCLTPFSYARYAKNMKPIIQRNADHAHMQTQTLDSLMEECGYDRYYALDTRFPFSRYSPVGPIIGHQAYLESSHPMNVETRENVIHEADLIIVLNRNSMTDGFQAMLNTHFTETVPPCAQKHNLGLITYFSI